MARVRLRSLSGAESRLLQEKLKDLSLSARIHQRYRVISEVRGGHSVAEAADRIGCHFTVAIRLGAPLQPERIHYLRTGAEPHGPSSDPQIRTTQGARGGGPVESRRARFAFLELVGAETVGVLSLEEASATGDG